MNASKRREMILELLYLYKNLSSQELIIYLKASSSTIRRDLTVLEQAGKVIRCHGGAKIKSDEHHLNAIDELPLIRKVDLFRNDKIRIASYAAELVHDGDCVFIDSGSTPAYIYDFIKMKNVIVVTNNVTVIEKVKEKDRCEVILTAGPYNPAMKLVSGPLCNEIINQYNFTHAFIGVSGFDISNGQCSCTALDASSIKKHAMHNAAHSYIVADSSKRKEKGIICFAFFNEFDYILTTEFAVDEKIDCLVFC